MRLLLIEDNASLSALLVKGLAGAGFDADVVATAADAAQALRTTRFAAAVLDLGLPDADGLSLLRGLRGRGDPIPVLVLTARGGLQDRVTALRSGADDYLHKPFALDELVARLQALLRRPGHLLATPLRLGNLSFDTEARQVLVDDAPFVFAPREHAILELLLRRSGHVVPKKLVEDQLYGLSNEASSNAVEVHVHRLRKRLSDVGATVQIHTVRGVGYLINEAKP